jgi:anti-sigma factor RsiW
VWCEIDPVELSAFVDGEVPRERAAEISAHAASCPSCRGELDRARKTDDAVRRPGPPAGVEALRADLLKRVDRIRIRSRLRLAVPIGVAAAAILIALKIAVGRIPAERPVEMPPAPSFARYSPPVDALALDAASIRLAILAENPDPSIRTSLDRKLDAIVDRIEKLQKTKPN